MVVTLETFFKHLGIEVHDCWFDDESYFTHSLPIPKEVVYNKNTFELSTCLMIYPSRPNLFEGLDVAQPFDRFDIETHTFVKSWVTADVLKDTLANYLSLPANTLMKSKMMINLIENRLAFPLSDYPKKPDGTYDNSFNMDTVIFDEMGEPYWSCPHQVALVKFDRFVTFVDSVRTTPATYNPERKTLKSKFVAVDPTTWKLYFDPTNP